jgi:hypothetical protein
MFNFYDSSHTVILPPLLILLSLASNKYWIYKIVVYLKTPSVAQTM